MAFEFKYRKNARPDFFGDDNHSSDIMGIHKLQNYVPIYSNFLNLTPQNFNTVNLNNRYALDGIVAKESYNRYKCIVRDCHEGPTVERPVFFKFSPLVDPVKYMLGKYGDTDIAELPTLSGQPSTCHSKMNDLNNVSYVDGMFSYLTSCLLNQHGFVHGTDYYGSFLGVIDTLEIDVRDDVEFLERSDHFHKHNGGLFHLDEDEMMGCDGEMSRKNKPKLTILADGIVGTDAMVLDITAIDCTTEQTTDTTTRPDRKYTVDLDSIDGNTIAETAAHTLRPRSDSCDSGTSTCSSSSVVTNPDDPLACMETDETDDTDGSEGSYDSNDGSDDCSNDGSYSDSEDDDDIMCQIDQFPVQAIALECCDGTLDSLFVNESIATKPRELKSAMFQIIMSLVVFQNAFGLTHNDLHTNNIVYCKTDIEFLFYKYKTKYYRVPTFGRIYKIIDFGRAIYKFRGKTLCSDSYHPTGDAGSQYNCEPYFNPKKPRLEPHFGFDLARLGCSLYELIDADANDQGIVDETGLDDIERMICNWVRDDKGRNILYMSNGEERYPGFKLYKMIARASHNHTPAKEIENRAFDNYIVPAKRAKKNVRLMDINAIPYYGGNPSSQEPEHGDLGGFGGLGGLGGLGGDSAFSRSAGRSIGCSAGCSIGCSAESSSNNPPPPSV